MKLRQVSPHIWSLRSSLLIIDFHVYLVAGDDGVTLVDTGLPFMASGILKAIDGLGAGPLRRILLTHGHGDHVGGIKQILQNRTVPVYAHRVELPYMQGDLPYPRRKKPEQGMPRGAALPLPEAADGTLEPVAGLTPCFTPGHSPGHVAYYHEQDRVLIAGDSFTARGGRLRPPVSAFSADFAEALRSCRLVEQLQPDRLEVCHGGTVLNPAAQFAAIK